MRRGGIVIHGMTDTPTYRVWQAMTTRCGNENSKCFHRYGGRGITVCDEWKKFQNFFRDMGVRPAAHVLDRIDNNKGYEPGNCRWVTQKQNCQNKSNNHFLCANGMRKTVSEWADELGCSIRTLFGRIRLGWTDERIVNEPIANRGHYDRSRLRRKISDSERLAATLLLLKRPDGSPLIPDEVRAKGSKAILSHVQWDHIVPFALGGSDDFHNLRPMTRDDHRAKTNVDIKEIARAKRIAKKAEEHALRVAQKHAPVPTSGEPTRLLFKDAKRPIKGKPFPKRDSCWKATPPKDIWADVE